MEERKSKRKSRPTRGITPTTLASLPATQDLLARLKSYADEGEDDEDEGEDDEDKAEDKAEEKAEDKAEDNKDNAEETKDEDYSTDSLDDNVQRTRRWAVVRRNLGHDCLNKKLLADHIREQTNAVATNLINVNDVGRDKDSPSKRASKRLSKLAKRTSKTP